MSSTTPTVGECRACGSSLLAGESLIVTPTDGGAPFLLHRLGVWSHCLWAAGRRESTTIAELDPAAARAFDRADGGSRANGATFEAQAFARNAAISAGRPRYELED